VSRPTANCALVRYFAERGAFHCGERFRGRRFGCCFRLPVREGLTRAETPTPPRGSGSKGSAWTPRMLAAAGKRSPRRQMAQLD
jgi:hypothetical protein